MADNRARVVAPQGTPHRYGLLSVTVMPPADNGHWINGIQFDQTCGVGVKRAYVPCDVARTPADFVKEPLTLDQGNEADALVLYAMVDCGFIGGGDDPALARAELAAGEARALEAEFALTAYANAGPPVGTTTDAVEALAALLVSWDAGVMPTIHMSPNVAVLLGDRIIREGDGLYLRTGEQVSVGYGYAEGAAQNGIDTGALFITGPVFGYSSEVIESASPRIVDNAAVTLAERVWLVASLCTTHTIILADLANGVVVDGGGA